MKEKIDPVTGKRMYDYLEVEDIKEIFRSRYVPENPYASGYGRKIPTQYVIVTQDGRKHRVYCCQFSNIGSLWINYQGKKPSVEIAMLVYEIKTGIHRSDFPVR